MGEAHFHVRTFVGIHEVNGARVMQTVDATADRARVDRLVEQYRSIGGDPHAAKLEIQEGCTCSALDPVECPACAFAHVGPRRDCPLCAGAGTVDRVAADAWYLEIESITSTRR